MMTNQMGGEMADIGMWLQPPITAAIIVFMDSKYQALAIKLTERENHRTGD